MTIIQPVPPNCLIRQPVHIACWKLRKEEKDRDERFVGFRDLYELGLNHLHSLVYTKLDLVRVAGENRGSEYEMGAGEILRQTIYEIASCSEI